MLQIVWRIIAIVFIVLILASNGCAKKKMIVAGPSCPNEPGIVFFRQGDGQWQVAQNLPWVHLNELNLNPEFSLSMGVTERELLHGGTISMPSQTSIEIAMYLNPDELNVHKALRSIVAKQMEAYGLAEKQHPFMRDKTWVRDNRCFALVHDKCTKHYIWLVIDPIPCSSKYQVLHAPGIGAEDYLVIKKK